MKHRKQDPGKRTSLRWTRTWSGIVLLLASTAGAQTSQLLGTASADLGCQRSGRFDATVFSLRVANTPFVQVALDAGTPGGETVVVDGGDAFERAVALLTDGRAQQVGRFFEVTGGGATPCVTSTTESQFFSYSAGCAGGVDFQGMRIDRIELDIRSFVILTGPTTTLKLKGRVRVYGRCLRDTRASGSAPIAPRTPFIPWDPSVITCSPPRRAAPCFGLLSLPVAHD